MFRKKSYLTFVILVFVGITLFIILFYLFSRPTLKNVFVGADTASFQTDQDRFFSENRLSERFSSNYFNISFNFPPTFAVEESQSLGMINLYRKTSGSLTPRETSLFYIKASKNSFTEKNLCKLSEIQSVLIAGFQALQAKCLDVKKDAAAPSFFNSVHQVYLIKNPVSNTFWYAINTDPMASSSYQGLAERVIGTIEFK